MPDNIPASDPNSKNGVATVNNGVAQGSGNSGATPFALNQQGAALKSDFSSGTSYTQKYNELTYKVELYLDNSGKFDNSGTANRYFINPSAVLNLSISDTVNDWVADGSITIMYLPEDAPSSQETSTGQSKQTNIGAKENANTLKSYQFRSDGYDLLRVSMVPQTNSKSQIQVNPNDPNWALCYLFSIYEVEDVTSKVPDLKGPAANYMKCVKMYFRDVRFQILKTTNLQYSTALSPKTIKGSGLANDGVLPTGMALNEVFNRALDGSLGVGTKEFTIPLGTDWDEGAGNVFYTSPADWSALDDINYLFSQHVSKTKTLANGVNDLCLLHTKKSSASTFIEQIALTPISNFFEQAGSGINSPGKLQLEHFFVTSHTQRDASFGSLGFRAPMGGSGNVDLKTSKYGQILAYNFVDMSADTNSSLFRSTPVCSVDIGKRAFNVEFKNNDVLSARKIIADSYISKLYKGEGGASNDKLFLGTIHKSKKSLNVFPTFSLNGDNKMLRQRNGILDLIYTGLFHNACITFKTFGLSLRKAGTFIGIDKVEGCRDNDYNNKVFGQWFVVKVDHIFEAGTYMNVIYAIKINRFKTQQTIFGDTL